MITPSTMSSITLINMHPTQQAIVLKWVYYTISTEYDTDVFGLVRCVNAVATRGRIMVTVIFDNTIKQFSDLQTTITDKHGM